MTKTKTEPKQAWCAEHRPRGRFLAMSIADRPCTDCGKLALYTLPQTSRK